MDSNRKSVNHPWALTLVWLLAGATAFAVTRTRLPYLWDSVEFALGVEKFDVGLSQPHPPGYFLYVMLGRLLNQFIGEPHASLVWLSVVAGGVLVALSFWLATQMFGRVAGVATGFLTLTSPMVWFYSSVALTYVVDAALVTGLMLVCWRAREDGVSWRRVVVIAVLLGVIGGVRQQSVLGMLVVVGATFCLADEQRSRKVIVAVAIWSLITAGWVEWMLAETGGWEVYAGALRRITEFHHRKTLWGGGVRAAGWNVFFAGLYCFTGLLAGGLILLAVGLRNLREIRLPEWSFLGAWVVPVFLLATLVGYTEAPGHVFTYLPALIVALGGVIGRLAATRWRRWLVIGLVTVNFGVFWFWPARWDGVLWGTMRTARELRGHDEQLTRVTEVIRERFAPEKTTLAFWRGDLIYGIRHFQWCLPEYDQVRLDPDWAMTEKTDGRLFVARGGQSELAPVEKVELRERVVVVLSGRDWRNNSLLAGHADLRYGDIVEVGSMQLGVASRRAIRLTEK